MRMLIFEVHDGANWIDKTDKLLNLSRSISSRELEKVEGELLESISVGQRIRLRKDDAVIFEGVVYEVKKDHRGGDVFRCGFTAYSDLILYDRHVVFRAYDTGTKAGSIIKDLASLESDVDVSNVDEDDTPALNSPWTIENETALKVMQSIAKGTNYWLRMKPGKKLYFKPKAIGEYSAIIDDAKIISAEYSEDRWKLKNRVIYVGAGGQVLADVSEGAGDLPVVVHDPFLTDPDEALRRANIRLALNKEYGKQLRVEMHQSDFENLNVDLGDTIRVNLPSLGLENVDMYLVEIEYDPREMRYTLTLGGRLELFEEFFEEAVGGDVAARFGQAVRIPEMLSTITITTEATAQTLKYVGDVKYPIYLNKPPLSIYNSQNIVLDSDGYAVLSSGATQGEFEVSVLPESRKFTAFIKCEWIAEKNDGSVSASILNANDEVIENIYDACDTQWAYIPRWPMGFGELTYRKASGFGASNASVSDVAFGLLNKYCLRLAPSTLGQDGEIYYPSTKDLNISLSKFKYLRLFLYGDHISSFPIKVRLCQDDNNYLEGTINVRANNWGKYESVLSTFAKTGNPEKFNWISIISPYKLLIDSDYVLLPFLRETLRLKFTLKRDSPDMNSPRIKLVKIIWREGDYQV
ncbi:MAG: hypothetical protein QW692_00610 [Nitrososphaerota archaeon]